MKFVTKKMIETTQFKGKKKGICDSEKCYGFDK